MCKELLKYPGSAWQWAGRNAKLVTAVFAAGAVIGLLAIRLAGSEVISEARARSLDEQLEKRIEAKIDAGQAIDTEKHKAIDKRIDDLEARTDKQFDRLISVMQGGRDPGPPPPRRAQQ